VQEVEYIQSLADHALAGQPIIAAIVGNAPVERGAVITNGWLKQMQAVAPLLVGIRRPVPGSAVNGADPCAYTQDDFLQGVKAVGNAGAGHEREGRTEGRASSSPLETLSFFHRSTFYHLQPPPS
jgi:hypothetical protein